MSSAHAPHITTVIDSTTPMLVSVVVSTFNRASKLPALFAALQAQTLTESVRWQLVIVDNRSTDDTGQAIRRLAQGCSFPVVAAFESQQGRSHGLNTGVALASGSIIAFTDDDVVPAPDWLERILLHFNSHERVMCVGGRVELRDPADALVSVRLSREPAVIEVSNFSASHSQIIGCNMAVRASALHRIGHFDPHLGAGTRIAACEDVDMLYRFIASGHLVEYDPTILVLHDHGRQTPAQVRHVSEGYSIGRGGFYGKYLLQADQTAIKWAYWELRRLVFELLHGGIVTRRMQGTRRHLLLIFVGASRYWRRGAGRGTDSLQSR